MQLFYIENAVALPIEDTLSEQRPTKGFMDALKNDSEIIQIWKMLPLSFLEMNKFIEPNK